MQIQDNKPSRNTAPARRRISAGALALTVGATLTTTLMLVDIVSGGIRVLEYLLFPGELATRLVPAGHDAGHLLMAIAASFAACALFYTVAAWMLIVLWRSANSRRSQDVR